MEKHINKKRIGKKHVEGKKRMQYKAIALDIDGTLLNSDKKLSKVNREAIMQAASCGVAVILATGRPLFSVLPIAKQLAFDRLGGYIIAYNGSCIFDCKAESTLYTKAVPKKYYVPICRAAKENGVQPLTYDNGRIFAASSTDEYVLRAAARNNAPIVCVKEDTGFCARTALKFLIAGEPSKLVLAKEALTERCGTALDLFFSEAYFLEVVPKNVGKDTALGRLAKLLHIKREECIACGDGMNDIAMLTYAGLGAAMGNAYPVVKEYADYIAASNDDNGVAEVIHRFLLEKSF